MRWFITIFLLLLVLVGAGFLFFNDTITTKLGLKPPPVAESPSMQVLQNSLKPDDIEKLELVLGDSASMILTRDATGNWNQAGNWALRQEEVRELVKTIGSLSTRFVPIPLESEAAALSHYGLDDSQKPVVVRVSVANKTETLRFGSKTAEGQPSISAVGYLQVNGNPEVLRISPDVLKTVGRSHEDYLRKQLFVDAPRVRIAGDATPTLTPIVGNSISEITVKTPEGSYSIKRCKDVPPARRDADRPNAEPGVLPNELATTWELLTPVRDRLDPAKAKSILSAIPEFWVDSFTKISSNAEGLKKAGLDIPERSITIRRTDGKTTTVKIGGVVRTLEREGPPGPQINPMIPPMPTKITEEYRYAQFEDNPLIFEMHANKLKDLAVNPDDLRDTTLARFSPNEVQQVQVMQKGQAPLTLVKKKGNKNAVKEADQQPRWYIGSIGGQPAESAKITELLESLAKLEAKNAPPPMNPMFPPMPPSNEKVILDAVEPAKLAELGLSDADSMKIIVQAQTEVPDGDPKPDARSYTFVLGKPKPETKKLPVQVVGWPRVNLVDDAVLKLVERPALAYRSRKPIDTADSELTKLKMTIENNSYELSATGSKPGMKWLLTKPVDTEADATKTNKLVQDLTALEVIDFADDAPKPEDIMAKYGLAKPRAVAELGFVGPNPKTVKLELGADVPGKPEVFARLDGKGSIFTLPKQLADDMSRKAEELVSLQQWQTEPEKIREIELTRAGQMPFTLKLVDGKWNLTGPYTATASSEAVQDILQVLSKVSAGKYETLAATDTSKFGFDKPMLQARVQYLEGETPQTKPRTRKLIIGVPTEPGAMTHFAKLDGETQLPNAVFIVPMMSFQPLQVSALDLLNPELLTLDPTKIAKIQLAGSTPDSNIVFVKDDKLGWKPEGTPFPIDAQHVNALVRTTARLPVIRLADYGMKVEWAKYGLDKPTQTITLSMSGEKPEIKSILLGKEEPTGERYVRVGTDGNAVGVISGAGAVALTRTKLDFVDRALLAFDPITVRGFTRKKGAEELVLAQAGMGWEVTKPTQFKADTQFVEELADQLSTLRANKIVAFGAKDLKPFGLDAPAANFTLKLGADQTKTLLIGKPVDDANPTGERYAMAPAMGDVAVGTISTNLATQLLGAPILFHDRSLGGFRGDPDRITIERGDRKTTFTRDGSKWKMTEPVAAEAEEIELDSLITAVAKLRADELVAEKPTDLKPFGLDAPSAKVRFYSAKDELLAVLLGTPEKAGSRIHAKLEKGDTVGLLDRALSQRISSEFRKRAVWSGVDASQVGALTISSGMNNFVLRKAGMQWLDATKPNEMIDGATVTDTLAALANLKAERYVADKDADSKLYGLDLPKQVIVVGQQGGVSKVLQLGGEVGGTDGKQVYARVVEPGRTDVFVLSAADTAKLKRDRAAYIAKK